MEKRILPSVVTVALLSGCSTYAADRYTPVFDGLSEADGVSPAKKVAVDQFTAAPSDSGTEIMCRAVGPITTPDGEPFAEYIRKALITQLRLTQSYSPEAATRISGSLDNINFDSHEGVWRMALTLQDNAGRTITVREAYPYKSSWFADVACSQTAQSLMPAVQNIVARIMAEPMLVGTAGGS